MMVVDYFHQRTTIVSAKACVNALDGLYCSKTAVKGPIPVLMPAAGGKIFAFVQTIPIGLIYLRKYVSEAYILSDLATRGTRGVIQYPV